MRAVCESFHLSKDAGFKVVAHMMPDLPNVGMERDIEQFIVSASKHYYSLWRMSSRWLNPSFPPPVLLRALGCALCRDGPQQYFQG